MSAELLPKILEGLNESEQEWVNKLFSEEYDQAHLFTQQPDASVEDRKRLIAQLATLDIQYPGGLAAYVSRGRKLLEDSRAGVNPYDGYTPEVPQGERLDVGTPEFLSSEELGLAQLGQTAFVLVAGGLGERLGYKGIKVALPSETTTDTTFLQLYAEFILAFQKYARRTTGNAELLVPLAIMTSDDTHALTVELLQKNSNFGLSEQQLTIMKQEKVPALLNNRAHFAVRSDDPFTVETKPHGHGDVHTLLHQYGLVSKWQSEGRKWILFFQDTNALVFRAVPAILGVSARNNFDVNSVTVPRRAGEAAGAICRLVHTNGSALTINVEYNQLDPMLRSSGFPEGDKADPATGFSPFPGNINCLVFAVDSYAKALGETGGSIPEFVNPKYKDATKTEFKTPTRLECMMQDFPKLLPADAKVGFVQFDRWFCFSAVKNNVADARTKSASNLPAESASSGECDVYNQCNQILKLAGVNVLPPAAPTSFLGISVDLGARVVLKPSFAVSVKETMDRFVGKDKITISPNSTLVIDGDVVVESLNLDGALLIRAGSEHSSKVVVRELTVKNGGWQLAPIDESDASLPESIKIRGYTVAKHDCKGVDFNSDGEYVLSDTTVNTVAVEVARGSGCGCVTF